MPASSTKSMNSLLCEYYRCPDVAVECISSAGLSAEQGYFCIGNELVGYGRLAGQLPAKDYNDHLPLAMTGIDRANGIITLPFDPREVVTNLRLEKYAGASKKKGIVKDIYYLLRPLMPVRVRRHLQRLSLRGWDQLPFPHWPVDRTVDRIHEWLLMSAMKAGNITELPFIWFWPEGHQSCATVTHDVETKNGRDFCGQLMDINDSYGIKTAFQVVPEERYSVLQSFLDSIRSRGFEVNVHDLNHDGHLFDSHEEFSARVKKINRYGKEFNARGFRAAVLYRNQEWMHALDFEYDMSVPTVAHLDPQHCGCCTVMPYFVGDLLEIPVTATQDYSLFNILSDYSITLWKRQISMITEAHGMTSFIIHPDYIIEDRPRRTYEELLGHLADMRASQGLWITKPKEINDWWRARAQMRLTRDGDSWRIEGKESERARIAYARIEGDSLTYDLQQQAKPGMSVAS